MKGIVRGVRGHRAQFGGASLEIFAHDDIVFYERKKGDIFTISQCDLLEYFGRAREDLEKLSQAAYLIELLDSVTTLGDKSEDVFDLLLNSLKMLSSDASPKRVARIFEIKLLNLMGLMPSLDQCANCGGAIDSASRFSFINGGLICKKCVTADRNAVSVMQGTVKFIEHIRSYPFEKVARIKVASEVGRELEHLLRKFLDYHIERRLKTVEFLKDIKSA